MKNEPSQAHLLAQIDLDRLPQHIAVIMDGNGRWAKKRHLPRIAGHRAGIRAVRQVVEACARLGVPYLTLYAFSIENWKRPHTEVRLLMGLLREYLKKEIKRLNEQNIRLGVIGRIGELPKAVQGDLQVGLADFINGSIKVRRQRRQAVTVLGGVIHQFAGIVMRAARRRGCRRWLRLRGGSGNQSAGALR